MVGYIFFIAGSLGALMFPAVTFGSPLPNAAAGPGYNSDVGAPVSNEYYRRAESPKLTDTTGAIDKGVDNMYKAAIGIQAAVAKAGAALGDGLSS